MSEENREMTSIDVLHQLAENRRQKVRNSVSALDQPDYLLMIMQTETSYVLEPAALPFSQIDISDFEERMAQLYGLKRENNHHKPSGDPIKELIEGGRRSNAIGFVDGKFEISDRDFIPIRAIRLTRERIHVVLKGPSSVADVIIADCIEGLWSCAGVNKKFEELSKYVQLKEYGTATKVKLPVKLESILSPGLISLLDDECIKGKKYAQHSAPKSYLNDFELNESLIANFAVDEVKIIFNIFDPVTGDHNTGQLRFSVTSLTEYGKGVYTVITGLPYDIHIQLIDDFVEKHRSQS